MTNDFLDFLIADLALKNDSRLSIELGWRPEVISKIRHKRIKPSSTMLIHLSEEYGYSIRHLKTLAGMECLRSLDETHKETRRKQIVAQIRCLQSQLEAA